MIWTKSPGLAEELREERHKVGGEKLDSTRIVVIDPGHGGADLLKKGENVKFREET